MTDTKLEPELPPLPCASLSMPLHGKPSVHLYDDDQVRAYALSAIEADRNKRAPAVSLTDEQVFELAKNAGFYSDDSLAAEFPNGYAEVQRRTIAFARALLSSVAPRASEGYVIVPVTLIEWAQQNIDNVEDEDERERISASLGGYIDDAIPTTAELPAT